MHCKNEADFKSALKEGPPEGVCLLYGGESFLIETYARKITGRFGGDFSSFNLQRLDGRKPDLDLLADAVETLPLMAREKCVFLDDLDVKGLPPSDLDRLLEIAADVPAGCLLLITGKAPLFDAKSAAAKKLIQACGEAGTAAELGARGTQGLVGFLRSAAKKQGCELEPDLARYILQLCENDMATLHNEIAKICAYAGGGRLNRAHVDAVAVPKTEARVFDLSKAILAGNPQRALELLGDLFYLREQPVSILAVLAMSYADLYRARVARDSGRTADDVVGLFGYKGREFRVRGAWNSRLSAKALRAALSCLLECDVKMKSTPADPKILLEQTVVRLLALPS